MKILWHSNAPWSQTGYGNQTAIMCTRLAAAGHEVAISAFYGLNGGPLNWGKIPVLPGGNDAYGNDVIQGHVGARFGGLKGGVVLSLLDVWVLNPDVWRPMDVAAWCPIDHAPIPPGVRGFFENTDAIPIAMSRFGERELAEFDPLYVPHGIETKVLKPVARKKARQALNIDPDKFLVGMVAANKGNPSRKSFQQAFEAFAQFRKVKENAHLYLHTEAVGINSGVHLPNLLMGCGIGPEAVTFVDQYRYRAMPPSMDHMAAVYSAMDVLLCPSMGEGFGIPIIEAQACGTPVIVTDFSAMTELCGSGWTVSGTKTWTYQESFQVTPVVDEIVWALNSAFDNAARMRRDAREFALDYDADKVMADHFLPALAECERRFAEKPVELKPLEAAAA